MGVCYYFSSLLGLNLELRMSDRGLQSLTFRDNSEEKHDQSLAPRMEEIFKQLDLYFGGKLREFSIPLDLKDTSVFNHKVWKALSEVPYGETRSYGAIAIAIGHSGAARAVGNANSRNPVPIIIPCHRVIRIDGSIGGYSSGLKIKRALLDHEAAHSGLTEHPKRLHDDRRKLDKKCGK